MQDSAEQIISLMFALGRLIREQGVHDEKSGIPSFIQIEMMKRIGDAGGLTMKEISNFLCIRAPSVTSFISDAIGLKLVQRLPDPSDRRIVRIVLTAKGKKMLETHYPKRASHFRTVLAKLPQSERTALVTALKHINDIYKNTI